MLEGPVAALWVLESVGTPLPDSCSAQTLAGDPLRSTPLAMCWTKKKKKKKRGGKLASREPTAQTC